MALLLIKKMAVGSGEVRIELSSGAVLLGQLNKAYRDPENCRLRGRTLDLKSAYRQLATCVEQERLSVIGVHDVHRKCPAFFVQRTMPFGASSSVLAFNRCSKALWLIGVVQLDLLWSCYFDDFPQTETVGLASSAKNAAELFLSIVGWDYAVEAKKNKAFDVEFQMLGVLVDFGDPEAVIIKNLPSRVEEICTSLEALALEGSMKPAVASMLTGRLQFTESQVMGRLGSFALAQVRERAHMVGGTVLMPESLTDALTWLCGRLRSVGPRRVSGVGSSLPVLVFTDGACEGVDREVATYGAVLYDPCSEPPKFEYFGARVEPSLMLEWTGGEVRQVIGQAELLPIFVARKHWARTLGGRRVIFFVDNNAALDGMIRGYSDSKASVSILKAYAEVDDACPCIPWFARVQSAANVADGPSRLKFEELEGISGSLRTNPAVVRTLMLTGLLP